MTTEADEPTAGKAPSKVERIKEQSRNLRGSLADELADEAPRFTEDSLQLLKFHGIYQQDDRDLRQQLRREGKDKHYMFMIRYKVPGGLLTADQYLAADDVASRYANDTLRITTRQDFQLHGVIKRDLKQTIRAINDSLITTIGACGDIERNVMCCPAPLEDRVRAQVQEYTRALSDHLLPKTQAYYEIWLDGEKAASTEPEHEPLYGTTYMPRKFKTGVAFPGDNCIDVYSQDIGIVPVVRRRKLAGFNVLVGGGLGMTHGKPETFPRVADPIAFVPPDDLTPTVETILAIQRDYGDRSNRKHARMKYLVDEWGVDKFKAEMERRLGRELAPPKRLRWLDVDDHLGWEEQGDGKWFLGVYVENGRIQDNGKQRAKAAFRELVETFRPGIRLTAQQNILFTDIPAARKRDVERLLRRHGVPMVDRLSNTLRYAMACPALPTCGLAMSDAERTMPEIVRDLEREIAGLGLEQERISVRMTGCPNGCARPYLGDLGFVGRTLNAYVVYVGGDFEGTRLNKEYADMVPTDKLIDTVRPLLVYYKERRREGERFGDFCHRIGVDKLRSYAERYERDGASGDGRSARNGRPSRSAARRSTPAPRR